MHIFFLFSMHFIFYDYCLPLCFLTFFFFYIYVLFHLQALELARSVQSQRDLGCQASQVVHLEEGLNCDDSLAEDFWRLLGGRRQYRGELVIFLFLENVLNVT